MMSYFKPQETKGYNSLVLVLEVFFFLLVTRGREGWPICWESVQFLVGSMALIQRSHAMVGCPCCHGSRT